MTLEDLYNILESKVFHDTQGRKFSFVDNTIHIDRRAFIPYNIYKENEIFFLQPDTAITNEKELRIETNAKGESILFYGQSSGEKLLTLE